MGALEHPLAEEYRAASCGRRSCGGKRRFEAREGEKWRKDEGRTKGRALQKVMLTGFEISSGRALVGFSTSQYYWDSNLTATECFGNSSTKGTKLTRSVRNSPMGLAAHRGLR